MEQEKGTRLLVDTVYDEKVLCMTGLAITFSRTGQPFFLHTISEMDVLPSWESLGQKIEQCHTSLLCLASTKSEIAFFRESYLIMSVLRRTDSRNL